MPRPGPEILIQPEGVRIPGGLVDLESFRRWARSGRFPEQGRIDWIGREVIVDVTPEDLNTHGDPKVAIARVLAELVVDTERGVVYVDRARITVPAADLSVEPDVTVIAYESVESRRVRLVPKARKREGRVVEIEGPADLVVECVSDSSVKKDRERLLAAYWRADVREYWLVDARGDVPELTIHVRRGRSYRASRPDRDGFVRSPFLARSVKLVRRSQRAGLVSHRLDVR